MEGWPSMRTRRAIGAVSMYLFYWALGGLMVGIWRVFQYVASAVSTHPQVSMG